MITSTLRINTNNELIKTKSTNLVNRIDELTSRIAENAFNKRRGLTLSTNTLSIEDKQALLDFHNQLRQETAQGRAPSVNGFHSQISDMNELVWDPALEGYASDYTAGCSGQPSPQNADMSQYTPSFVPPNNADNSWGKGENIWYSDATTVSLVTLKSAIQAWFDESSNYIAGAYSTADYCKFGTQCNHFTQMVWAKTRYVGCAFHQCPSSKVFFSCNYWPSGNNRNVWPYTPGTPCSNCDGDRKSCNNGLCSGGLDSSYSIDSGTNIDICTDGLGRSISNLCGDSDNGPFNQPTPKPTHSVPITPSTPSGKACGRIATTCLRKEECCSQNCDTARYRCN